MIFQVWAGPGLEKCSNQCCTELFQQTHITYVDPWAPSSLIWSNLIWTESTAVVSLWAFQQCWLSTCEWKSFVVIVKQPSWWAFSITSITLVNVRTLYTSEALDLWRANETMWLWLIFYHYWVVFAMVYILNSAINLMVKKGKVLAPIRFSLDAELGCKPKDEIYS